MDWASESERCAYPLLRRPEEACEGYLQPKLHVFCGPGRNSGHCLNTKECEHSFCKQFAHFTTLLGECNTGGCI